MKLFLSYFILYLYITLIVLFVERARMKLVPLFSDTLEIEKAHPKCKSIMHIHYCG